MRLMNQDYSIVRPQESVLTTNKLIKNTYILLSMTLLFSAATAGLSMVLKVPPMISLVASFGALGILWFVLPRFANSAAGIGIVFLVTGLLGVILWPVIEFFIGLLAGLSGLQPRTFMAVLNALLGR